MLSVGVIIKRCLPFKMPVLLLTSFLVWFFIFRDFLNGSLQLQGDAVAYYEHFEFFIKNISRGVYPLWESTREMGVPVEFFLRRIGSFNPLFFFIIILNKIGLPYTQAYMAFLGLYYFLGMIGFYLLALRLFKDEHIAFLAYLLLMFSYLGTRLFDSYIHLTSIPMIWFFYFFIAFSQKPERFYFLGIIFTLMILMTTYIPFYFITIFLFLSSVYILFYTRETGNFLMRSLQFLKSHKIFVLLCSLLLLASMLPGLLFYLDSNRREIIVPVREIDSQVDNVFAMGLGNIDEGAFNPSTVWDHIFVDLPKYQLGIFYIPFFAYIILLLSAIVRFHKRMVLFFVWGFLIYLLSLADAAPLAHFFYKHVFYFKFFRNYTIFLPLILLPIFILFICDAFKLLLAIELPTKKARIAMFSYLCLIHVGLAVLIGYFGKGTVSSHTIIILSFMFFCSYFFLIKYLRLILSRVALMFLILVVAQPIEVYSYLAKNTERYRPLVFPYRYGATEPYLHFPLPEENSFLMAGEPLSTQNLKQVVPNVTPPAYISLRWYHWLKYKLNDVVFLRLTSPKLIVYDQAQEVNDLDSQWDEIEEAFIKNKNLAFVDSDGAKKFPLLLSGAGGRPQVIARNSDRIQLLDYNVNFLKLKTKFNIPKFLVYNDCFHSEWQVFINGKEADLYRANIAFKGVWLPAGENIVYFRFGALWRYALNYFLLGLYMFVFIYLVVVGMRFRKNNLPLAAGNNT